MQGVLVDTSVWIAHFRAGEADLARLLDADEVLCHPLVILEVACGTPPAPRERTLRDMRVLRQATVATFEETLRFVERERLMDRGCGAVDVALLAATLLTPGAVLWSTDKHLAAEAARLGVAYRPKRH